jgi:hypothetical protein
MGRDALEVWGWENACKHYGHNFQPVYEDDILSWVKFITRPMFTRRTRSSR